MRRLLDPSRLSLRLRLTIAFGLVMTLAFGVTGLVVYRSHRSSLTATIDSSLAARVDELTALVRGAGTNLNPMLRQLSADTDDFTQVLTPDGTTLGATPQLQGQRALLGPAELRRALHQSLVLQHPAIAELDGALRVHAVPVATVSGPRVLVVGTALGARDTTLRELATLLIGAGAAALLLACLAAYGVAAAALRRVDDMRDRAASISSEDPGRRLPVARSQDEIARLGTTLNEMLDRLHAAFGRERRFAADASHELRTPLGILKVELELALREGRTPQELRAALESASEETERLVQLAEDLLVIARLDQGRGAIGAAEVEVAPLLGDVAARFAERAEAAGRSVGVRAGGPDVVAGNRPQLEQALANLVDNALRHGGGAIELRALTRDGRVELHVLDAGPGFPADFLGQAFERFTRADSARPRGGAGLGLAIVAAIASAHAGGAHAANRPGGGADVWIELLAVRAENGAGERGGDEALARVSSGE